MANVIQLLTTMPPSGSLPLTVFMTSLKCCLSSTASVILAASQLLCSLQLQVVIFPLWAGCWIGMPTGRRWSLHQLRRHSARLLRLPRVAIPPSCIGSCRSLLPSVKLSKSALRWQPVHPVASSP